MEIESFFSNSLPFTLQNDFSTCLILSFHTIFRGFNISVNNLVQTRPQASTTPAAHTRDNTIMQNFCTFEIGNSDLFPRKHHLHFFHSLTTRVSMSNAFWLLEAFQVAESRSPVESPCFSGMDLAASHFNDMFAIKSKSLILLILYHSSIMNDFQEGFLFSNP